MAMTLMEKSTQPCCSFPVGMIFELEETSVGIDIGVNYRPCHLLHYTFAYSCVCIRSFRSRSRSRSRLRFRSSAKMCRTNLV